MLSLSDLRGDRRIHEEINSLSKNGMFVTIVYPVKARNTPEISFQKNVKIIPVSLKSELLFHRIKRVMFHLGTAIMFLEIIIKIRGKLKTESFDYIHCHDTNALFLAFLVNNMKVGNIVYDAHELYPETIQKSMMKFFWTKFEQFILPKLKNRIIATNKQRAQFIINKYKLNSQLTIYDNSSFIKVDFSKFDVNEKIQEIRRKGYKILVHLGALTTNRDLDKLLVSIEKKAGVAVIFIGQDFGFKSANSDTILSLGERFIHIEQVEQNQILKMINGCDIGIVFYRQTNMNNILAAPNKIYDYMSMEIPTLGSNSPTIKEILNNGSYGEVVDSNDTQEISKQISKMLTRIEFYKRNLRMDKSLLLSKYSRESQNKSLLNLYEQLESKIIR